MPEMGERGYAEWDRENGWSNGDSDDGGKINRKKINIDDLDVNVPVSKIGDDDSEKPEVDIEDDNPSNLNIVPVTPNSDVDDDDEAVIRDSIIRQGILDESKSLTSENPDLKEDEIN